MTMKIVIVIVLVIAMAAFGQEENAKEDKAELLEGSESQNYGYGYGTKVEGPHGTSTVYVQGFGTDDGYNNHEEYNGGHNTYGYGHIDPYMNAKHGYRYTKGHGYGQMQGYAGYAGPAHYGVVGHGLSAGHHGLAAGHHGISTGHHGLAAVHHGRPGVVSHGLGVAHHGGHHGVGHLPAGYGAPQPFVGNGFQYGHGYGYGYGQLGHH